MKLGKRPAAIRLGMPSLAGHAMASMPASDRLDRSWAAFTPGLYDNDRVGDCTAVGLANYARAVAALGGFDLPIATADVLRFYSACSGYDPARPESDVGAAETEVLMRLADTGFDYRAESPLAALWGTIDPGDLNAVRAAAVQTGACYLGVALAEADQAPGVWDVVARGGGGDPTPGSWGGHCLLLWSYAGTGDTDLVQLVTWGTFRSATWRWLRSRMDEAHACVWPTWLSAGAVVPHGVDCERLADDGMTWACSAEAAQLRG